VIYGAIINDSPILISVGKDRYFLKYGNERYQIIGEESQYNVLEHCMSPGCGNAGVPRERKILKSAFGDITEYNVDKYLDAIVASFNEG
jgi:hypothetical protein